MQVNQNITPFLGGKSTGRTCTICSERFNQKSLGMKYLILMAARMTRGLRDFGFGIADCGCGIDKSRQGAAGRYLY